MAKRAQYKVTVSYEEHTPEEAARIEAEITAALYRAKKLSMRIEEEKRKEKEAANT